jgi:hypothetical protein
MKAKEEQAALWMNGSNEVAVDVAGAEERCPNHDLKRERGGEVANDADMCAKCELQNAIVDNLPGQ